MIKSARLLWRKANNKKAKVKKTRPKTKNKQSSNSEEEDELLYEDSNVSDAKSLNCDSLYSMDNKGD